MIKTGLALCLPGLNPARTIWAGAIYHVEAQPAPWLWPSLALTGIILELCCIFNGNKWLLCAGFAAVLAGALPERDLTLLVGNCLACIAIYAIAKK